MAKLKHDYIVIAVGHISCGDGHWNGTPVFRIKFCLVFFSGFWPFWLRGCEDDRFWFARAGAGFSVYHILV